MNENMFWALGFFIMTIIGIMGSSERPMIGVIGIASSIGLLLTIVILVLKIEEGDEK
jgi:hypothetical protein